MRDGFFKPPVAEGSGDAVARGCRRGCRVWGVPAALPSSPPASGRRRLGAAQGEHVRDAFFKPPEPSVAEVSEDAVARKREVNEGDGAYGVT